MIIHRHTDGRIVQVYADRKVRLYSNAHRTFGAPYSDEWPVLWRRDVPNLTDTEWYAPPSETGWTTEERADG